MLTRQQAALLPRIYDAAVSEDNWPAALDAVVEGSVAKGATLFALDTIGLPFAIQKFSSLYTASATEYFVRNFSQYETEGWNYLRSKPAQTLVMDQEIWPEVEGLNTRPDYVWMLENSGVMRRGAARLNDTPGWSDSLALQFDASLERVPQHVIEQAAALLPHIAKVVQIHRSFAILRARFEAALTALDRVKIGVCIATGHGTLIQVNREAERIFDLADGLVMAKDNRFLCLGPEVTAEVAAAIENATLTVQGTGETHETVIAVTRPSGAHPFLIEVAPLSDSAGELEPNLRGAIVFIVDPQNPRPFTIENMTRCFLLSHAEAQVCTLMVQGLTSNEIAAERDVSIETVRSQIKAVYAKTNTNRRADLIRLTLSITPPIEVPLQRNQS